MRPHPIVCTLVALTVLTGCASSSAVSDAPTRVRGITRAGTASTMGYSPAPINIVNESSRAEQRFEATTAEVWRALTAAFVQMEIPVTEVEESQHRLRTERVRVVRIDGDRMATFLDCGTNVSGQRANTYSITLDLVTTLEDGSGSTLVRTVLNATARSRDTAGSALHCTSTGELENRIFRSIFSTVVEGGGGA